MYPVEPIGGGTAPSQIYGASSRQRCGNDGQRKRVAHMPTARTTKEDSRSKLVQDHPHDFTKKLIPQPADFPLGTIGRSKRRNTIRKVTIGVPVSTCCETPHVAPWAQYS